MRLRYIVVMELESFKVVDQDWKEYKTPQMAVSLYFKKHETALAVAEILNKEWFGFLRNPT